MAPQDRRGMQGLRPRMLQLWKTWTFFKSMQRSDYQHSEKTAVKHIDMEEQPPDYFQSEYITPYFITNEQGKVPIKCLKTTARVHHTQGKDTKHIRPLCVTYELSHCRIAFIKPSTDPEDKSEIS